MIRHYGNQCCHQADEHAPKGGKAPQVEFPQDKFGHDTLLIITRLTERAYRVLLESKTPKAPQL